MKRLAILLVLGITLASLAATQLASAGTAAGPTITSLSASSLARSGRLLVSGSGFGATQGASTLVVGGRTAFVTRWSDTLVVGYVPEATAVGQVGVQIVVGGTVSNAVPLMVTLRQSNGRVRWRFQVDAQVGYLLQRPAIGPDGTVVAHDPAGNVYALTPDGALKWIFKTALFAAGPPSIGADGTVYVASGATIYALSGADGSLKWSFTDAGQGVIVGPTVGPDGNIYAVTDLSGSGALALSPTGQLLWTNVGNPPFAEMGQQGAEVAFGQGRLYAGVDLGVSTGGVLHAITLAGSESWAVAAGGTDTAMQGQRQPVVGPDGTVYMTASPIFKDPCNNGCGLYAFDPATGAVKWYADGMSEPTVANDGTIVVGRSLSYLAAVTPAGQTKWSVFDGGVLAHPTVDPQDTQILSGESPNYGLPGFVNDFSAADGHLVWQIALPSENAGFQVFYSRPRFTPDGQTAYFGTFISAPASPDQYAYLYAVDTSGSQPPPPPPPPSGPALKSLTVVPAQVRGGMPANGTVTLTGAAPSGGAVVKLSSSAPNVASVPPTVTVRAGATSATFRVSTKFVFRTTAATISSAYAGVTKTSPLTVTR